MTSAALPLIDLVYRRGHLRFSDSETTAVYFFWFSLSLAFWSAQSLYARAFYAAGDTRTPMIASTLITLGSLPVYSALYRHFSTVGLVVASDLGIAANCFAMALLLNRRGMVPAAGLEWKEIAKTLVNASLAAVAGREIGRLVALEGSRAADLEALALTTLAWLGVAATGLWLMKSKLPADFADFWSRRRATKSIAGAPTEC